MIDIINNWPAVIDLANENGTTIIHFAALHGRLSVMEVIISHAPQAIDRVNNRNQTPLIYASYYDHVAPVKWLLEHDADISIKGSNGKTALDLARNKQTKDIFEANVIIEFNVLFIECSSLWRCGSNPVIYFYLFI